MLYNYIFVYKSISFKNVKEPSVTAHYEHAHDEWSIRDLLHWQIIPPYPSSFIVSSPVAFKFLNEAKRAGRNE
jgi:hypothetical protein